MAATTPTAPTTPDAPQGAPQPPAKPGNDTAAKAGGNGNGKPAATRAKSKPGKKPGAAKKPDAAKPAATKGPREGSALHAAITVLKTANGPLTPAEILDRAKKKGLATGLKGKTPEATMGAQLATANKNERYVERPEPGKYQLRK